MIKHKSYSLQSLQACLCGARPKEDLPDGKALQ